MSWLAFNKWIDADKSGSYLTLRWRTGPTQHFDLTRFNGEIESYMPCTDLEFCYLNEYHSSNGEVLTMQRDSQRRLTSMSAPHDNWLRLDCDPQPETQSRVTNILDSRGRKVVYRYNHQNQLADVTYPSGEIISYTYDSQQNLLTVSAASSITASPTVLMTNHFQHGKLVSQTLSDPYTQWKNSGRIAARIVPCSIS